MTAGFGGRGMPGAGGVPKEDPACPPLQSILGDYRE
jgi:hypothetical protein